MKGESPRAFISAAKSQTTVTYEGQLQGMDDHLLGNYAMKLELDEEDVARLFVDTFANMDLNKVLTVLHKAREWKGLMDYYKATGTFALPDDETRQKIADGLPIERGQGQQGTV